MSYRNRVRWPQPGAQQFGMQSWRRSCAGFLLALAVCGQAFGQVSLLDSSFNVGPGANEAVNALLVQADQRILVGGEFTTVGGCSNAFLARLNADGSVDTAFNPAGQTDGFVRCLVQQPDRKVLVGGGFGMLLGQTRPALARLLENGSVDTTFDASAVLNTNTHVFAGALQDDGRLLVSYRGVEDSVSRIARLNPNGTPDASFVCTNQFDGYVLTFLPQPDGSILFGGAIYNVDGLARHTLFRLKADGKLDDTFDPGLEMSTVFNLVRQTNGQILVGGRLKRTGGSNSVPLLRLNVDLQWDESFQTDRFVDLTGGIQPPYISAFLLQPDGKLIAGGYFFEVGGYWRRHIIRLTFEGHADACFDPGLGLGDSGQPSPVRAMVPQSDGRILIGGAFQGIDTAYGQGNLARLLPQSDCDLIRVYIRGGDAAFVAATFPPAAPTTWRCRTISRPGRAWRPTPTRIFGVGASQ